MLGTNEVAELSPVCVRDPGEEVDIERTYCRRAQDPHAPGLLAKRGLQDDVVSHHGSDALWIVVVEDAHEPLDERLAVEFHRSLPLRLWLGRAFRCAGDVAA
jgi:hypothetical protein